MKGGEGLRFLLSLLLSLIMAFPALPLFADHDGRDLQPVLRALLVACDDFISQPDTTPSSFNNVTDIRRALLSDERGYSMIRVSLNQALDKDSFSSLVQEAFQGAKENDFSFFYLSTHGVRLEGSQDFVALFSDGETETYLTGQDIQRALSAVPGKKFVILDACYSGAAINKGMDQAYSSSPFSGDDFKVLTSSGGMEPSFLWTNGAGTVQGGSFFAQALTDGITSAGQYAADTNRDGQVTLKELYRHQLKAYGASTPQVYPQNDDFVVFQYQPETLPPGQLRTVTGLEIASPHLLNPQEPILFSYTLNQTSRLAYQLIYESQSTWRFQHPQSIAEEGRGDGVVLPGRKEAALQIKSGGEDLSGYFLLLLITVFEDYSRPQACVLLSVQTRRDDPGLKIESLPSFTPGKGEEAAFVLRHTGVVSYSARVLDKEGNTVAIIESGRMSRPLHLAEEGSQLWWDGKTKDGSPALPGEYRLRVTVISGNGRQTLDSEPFRLLENN